LLLACCVVNNGVTGAALSGDPGDRAGSHCHAHDPLQAAGGSAPRLCPDGQGKRLGGIRGDHAACIEKRAPAGDNHPGRAEGTLLGGAVLAETIFALPGLGRLVVDSIFARDFPIVQGVILFLALTRIACNFVVDITYALLDPRIRYE
jgi:Binding-protein-dependent transport system inner membrane component